MSSWSRLPVQSSSSNRICHLCWPNSNTEGFGLCLFPLNVTRLREIQEDHESDEDDVPVDDDVENLDVVDQV